MGGVHQNTGNRYEGIFQKFRLGLQNWCRTGKEPVAGDQELYQKQDYLAMYQTILDPEPEDKGLGQTAYVCPNCGSISKLEVLQETGCPYCGTRYLMKDLYPKVTNYYFVDTGSKPESGRGKLKFRILLAAACASLLQTGYAMMTDAEMDILSGAMTLLVGFGFWAFIIYFVYSMWLLIHAGKEAAEAVSLVGATAGSKAKITRQLQECDPAFDYEYFEGQGTVPGQNHHAEPASGGLRAVQGSGVWKSVFRYCGYPVPGRDWCASDQKDQ